MSNFSLQFDTDFKRAQPATALTAELKFYKTFNFSLQPDCLAGMQLTNLMEAECNTANQDEGYPLFIRQAYNPNIILGQDAIARQINQKELDADNQKVDLSLLYQPCYKTWSMHSKKYTTVYTEDDIHHMIVKSPHTCELQNPLPYDESKPEEYQKAY